MLATRPIAYSVEFGNFRPLSYLNLWGSCTESKRSKDVKTIVDLSVACRKRTRATLSCSVAALRDGSHYIVRRAGVYILMFGNSTHEIVWPAPLVLKPCIQTIP